ncbi:MAG: hypothetical protein ACFFDN_51550, partial [Candidatus Hodarchaeota archaeon]
MQFNVRWYSIENLSYIQAFSSKVNDTYYKTFFPNLDGTYKLYYEILTYDDFWNNKSIILIRDTTLPRASLNLRIVNETNPSFIRNAIVFNSSTIFNVAENDLFRINFTDLTSIRYNISLLYSNGTFVTKSFSENKDFFLHS